MQDALSHFEPTIGNAKDILVLRALVMHTHLVRPQHHQCELAGCVVHVCPPPLLLTAMSVGDVKVGLTLTAQYSASAQRSDNGERAGPAGPDTKIMGDNGATGAASAREGRPFAFWAGAQRLASRPIASLDAGAARHRVGSTKGLAAERRA
jgi:hypothetical protein